MVGSIDIERAEYKGMTPDQIRLAEAAKERAALKNFNIELAEDHMMGYMYKPDRYTQDRTLVEKPWEASILDKFGPNVAIKSETAEKWSNKDVLFEIREGIAYVTLNRPDNNNAMNEGTGSGMHDAWRILRSRPDIRVVVFSGNGRMFCAGGDPKAFQAEQAAAGVIGGQGGEGGGDEEEVFGDAIKGELITGVKAAFETKPISSANSFGRDMLELASLPQFTICCMNGSAMGGGVGLISACDYVVAVKNAHVTLSEVKLGVIPAVISPHVIRSIGTANAKRLFCTGENCNMAMAMSYGLVQRIVNDVSEFPAVVKELSTKMTACAPGAVAAAKQTILNCLNQQISQSMIDYTCNEYTRIRKTKECEEGMKALMAKKKPSWVEKKIEVKES